MKRISIKKVKNKILIYKICFLSIKIVNDYYQKHKERFRKEACKKYQNLSEGEKNKRPKKVRETYQKLPEEQKEKLPEYMKKYYLVHKK